MLKAFTHLQVRLSTRDRGATAVEYALMVVGLALLVLVGAKVLGNAISNLFNNVATKL